MLMDVLGIAIAFVTIILFLSLLVTSAVQAFQAVLRLRARNLMKGLGALILDQRKKSDETVTVNETQAAKRDAMRLLNTKRIALVNRIPRLPYPWLDKLVGPESWLRYWVIGPRVSWVNAADLPVALQEVDPSLSAEQRQQIAEDFERLGPYLNKRFQMLARVWSFLWALVIAAALQVSTPALLNKLSTNAEYRERILANNAGDMAYAGEALARRDYEAAASTALAELAKNHPDLRERIEQASGVGVTKAFIVDELRIALEGVASRDPVLREYEQLLDQGVARDGESRTRELLGRLSAYDIDLWRGGSEFYYRKDAQRRADEGPDGPLPAAGPPPGPVWGNITGVLMTAILLSLGAPWWYKVLGELVGLRDLLSGKKPARDAAGSESAAQPKPRQPKGGDSQPGGSPEP